MITHSVSEALQSDRVVFMNKGCVEFQGNPEDIFSNIQFIENHKHQIPESTQILYYLKKCGYEVNLKSFASKECANEIIKLLENAL